MLMMRLLRWLFEVTDEPRPLKATPGTPRNDVAIDKAFRPDPKLEKPPDELHAKAEENWARVPAELRAHATAYLAEKIDPELLAHWRDQLERGKAIGSDDPWFHFGAGMAVRNCLRHAVRDEALPPVEYPEGGQYRNWDDFYTAALREAVELTR